VDDLEVVMMYNKGLSIREIAALCGTYYGKVRKSLIASGVKLRPRGGFHKAS
jgi:DNA-directed RNA polymerase specialized sigma24 family protein